MKKSGFRNAGIWAAALSAAFLLFTFTLLPAYLKAMTGEILSGAEQARQAVLSGEEAAAAQHIANINAAFEQSGDMAKLFLDHRELDELECALSTAADLAALGQSDNLICELNRILSLARHMEEAEGLSWSGLL